MNLFKESMISIGSPSKNDVIQNNLIVELNQSDSLNDLLNSNENYFDPIDVKNINLQKFKNVDTESKIGENNTIKERSEKSELSNSSSEKTANLIENRDLAETSSQLHFKNSTNKLSSQSK